MNSTQKPNVPGMVERTCFDKSAALRQKVHDTIPGGAHTYAKGDDQYPERSPGFIERGKGCHIWDVDGNEFIEYGMGLRAVTLGHAYPSVIEAAYRQMQLGNNFNRPAPIELECAQMLQSLVPSAEMVKFAKDGSTVLTAALKLARAYTGRDLVAICSNSPFFSYNDWFIGTTAMDGGVSRVEVELTVKFNYNDIDSLQKLFDQYPGRIAMVLLEPARTEEPKDGFLQKVIDLAHRNGALVTLDETISGFRFHQGGAQTLYGVTPDLSCFGKALANGFSLSALTGKREVMELGGLFHDKARVFLLSTTHGAEGPSLAAAIETMRIYRDEPVIERLYHVGRLDIDTSGLLLLTNDGELANRLTHPSYEIRKTYVARLHGEVKPGVKRTLMNGIELEDGPIKVDSFRIVDTYGDITTVEIVVHEGRNRLVRRMMEAVGYPVRELVRTGFGPITLDHLKQGTTRRVKGNALTALYGAVGL